MREPTYNPLKVADWAEWQNSDPLDPRELIAMTSLQIGANTDMGAYLNSTNFAAPPPSNTHYPVRNRR
jgi:hypothetical protein